MMSVSPAVAPSHSTIQALHFSSHSLNNTQNAVASSSKLPRSNGDGKTDSVSSLREAALSTLKTKRRKLLDGSSARPAAPPSVQLDYGSNADSAEDVPTAPRLRASNAASRLAEVDKADHREEGEISDDESELSVSTHRISLQDRIASPFRPLKRSHPSSSRSSTEKPDLFSVLAYSDTFPPPVLPAPGPAGNGSADILPLIDENHVRPGLPMTFSQYNQAKKTVLDLLGWGVHPEYLVDCGISRETVFYVFTELNLRLPQNLDASGIPRFEPPFFSRSDEELASQTSQAPEIPSSLPPSAPDQAASDSLSITRPSATLNNLAETHNFAAPSPTPNLHDIEAQRRQQLLARKAVLASRKNRASVAGVKPPVPANTTPLVLNSISNSEEASFNPVLPDTVDDFLKTIGGPSSDPAPLANDQGSELMSTSSSANEAGPPQLPVTQPPPTMDVDEIPGLGPFEQPSSSHPTSSSLQSSTVLESLAIPKSLNDDSTSLSPSIGSVSSSRRNGKRPVATDFADFDSLPLLPSMPSRPASAQFNGAAPPYMRRKLGPFANLTGPRRCVIEWSDSEDDSRGNLGAIGTKSIREAKENRIPLRNPVQSSYRGTPSGTSTPDPSASTPLELEIKRMKEMIAERERKMKKNQATATKPSTPTEPVDHTTSTVTPIALRQNSSSSVSSTNETSEVSSAMTISPVDSTPDQIEVDQVIHNIAELDPSSEALVDVVPTALESGAPPTLENSELRATAEEQLVPTTTSDSTIDSPQRPTTPEPNEQKFISTPFTEIVDDSEVSSSAKVSESHLNNSFSTYRSVFDSYPLLRPRQKLKSRQASTSDLGSSTFLISDSTLATMPTNLGDMTSNNTDFLERVHSALRPLSVIVALRRAAEDPQLQICQYEVPGGGQCKDATCKDLHLADLEPSDQETAQYLCGNAFLSQHSVSDFISVLQSTRIQKQKQGLPYHERVGAAVLTLKNSE